MLSGTYFEATVIIVLLRGQNILYYVFVVPSKMVFPR
jgi:hypothetical protein